MKRAHIAPIKTRHLTPTLPNVMLQCIRTSHLGSGDWQIIARLQQVQYVLLYLLQVWRYHSHQCTAQHRHFLKVLL